jgi:hypothetical protein
LKSTQKDGHFNTHIALFQEKNFFWPYLVDSENFGPQECDFRQKLFKIRKNVFTKQVLDFV